MKFKVVATLIVTKTLIKTIEANNLEEATREALRETERKDWVSKAELKTSSK